MVKITDAPDLFIKACGYFLVSICLAPKIDPFFVRKANAWFLLSSKPKIGRRTFLIDDLTIPLFRKCYSRYMQIMFNTPPTEADKLTTYSVLESGTVEGLIDAITDAREQNIDRFAVVSSEFGSILKAAVRKDYLADYLGFVTKILHDGEDYRQSLSARGKKKSRYIPRGLFTCSLLGMQDPHLYVTREQFEQGFMRRFVFIYQAPEDKTRWLSPLDFSRLIELENLMSDASDFINEMVERMVNFCSPSRIVLEFHSKDWIDIEKEISSTAYKLEQKHISDPDDMFTAYHYHITTHQIKLMILEALARLKSPIYSHGAYTISVSKKDYNRVAEFLRQVLKASKPVLEELDFFLATETGKVCNNNGKDRQNLNNNKGGER